MDPIIVYTNIDPIIMCTDMDPIIVDMDPIIVDMDPIIVCNLHGPYPYVYRHEPYHCV